MKLPDAEQLTEQLGNELKGRVGPKTAMIGIHTGGVWVAQANGSTRRLGAWNQASWSPFGRFVVAARANELTTLEPDGQVHWTLARPSVSAPSWGGTRTDTRIAYVSARSLRVVAGDGTDDRSSCADIVGRVTPVWQPGAHRVLAVAAPDGVVSVYGVDGCRLLWRARPGSIPRKLAWSSDGRLLLVLSRPGLKVYDGRGHIGRRGDLPANDPEGQVEAPHAHHELQPAQGVAGVVGVDGGQAPLVP